MSNFSSNLTSILYSPDLHPDPSMKRFVPPEPIEQFGVLGLLMLLSTVFAWYCMQLRSNDASGMLCCFLGLFSVLGGMFTATFRAGWVTICNAAPPHTREDERPARMSPILAN